jgi:hypothetical protein
MMRRVNIPLAWQTQPTLPAAAMLLLQLTIQGQTARAQVLHCTAKKKKIQFFLLARILRAKVRGAHAMLPFAVAGVGR